MYIKMLTRLLCRDSTDTSADVNAAWHLDSVFKEGAGTAGGLELGGWVCTLQDGAWQNPMLQLCSDTPVSHLGLAQCGEIT